MSSSKTRDFSIVNMFLGIQDLPDVVTASKSYLLSPVVVDTPDSSSYWDLHQHANTKEKEEISLSSMQESRCFTQPLLHEGIQKAFITLWETLVWQSVTVMAMALYVQE